MFINVSKTKYKIQNVFTGKSWKRNSKKRESVIFKAVKQKEWEQLYGYENGHSR